MFAVTVAVWVTVMLEMWKRKMSWICKDIGINPHNQKEKELNTDYIGNNSFDWTNYKVSKDTTSKHSERCWFALCCLYFIFILASSVGLYAIVKIFE